MKKVPYGLKRSSLNGESSLLAVSWNEMKLNDEGQAFRLSAVASVEVQFSGIFGEGGSVLLEGSVDGETFHAMKTPQGEPMRAFDKCIMSLGQFVRFVRPVVLSGDENTKISCAMHVTGRS